jgi:fucose permease
VLVAFTGGMGILAGILFLAWSGRPGASGSGESQKATVGHIIRILKRRKFWVFAAAIFFGGGAEAGFTFWSASYIQLHYGGLARAGGIGTAVFAAGMILGRMGSGHLVGQKGLRKLILLSALIGMAISGGVFLLNSLEGFYVLLFFAGLSVACFWPSIQSYAADVLAVDSTMLFILLSCAGIPGFGSVSWVMGIIGDAAGLHLSFAVVPVYFFLLLMTILLEGRFRKTQKKEATPF